MRVVLDTNVLLSGLFGAGVCKLAVNACLLAGGRRVVVSEHILGEFDRVAQAKFGVPAREVRDTIAFLREVAELVVPDDVPAHVCRDPDDLPILGTAVAARADCLVTGDADLLELGEFEGIPILSPREFLNRLR